MKRGGEGKADSWRDELFMALLASTGQVTFIANTDKYERGLAHGLSFGQIILVISMAILNIMKNTLIPFFMENYPTQIVQNCMSTLT